MQPEAKLKGKRVAVFVEQLYQEMEVWYPYYRLIEEGAEVHLVGPEAGKSYPSKTGYPAVASKSFAQIKPADYDGVVAPGGCAPDFIRRNPAANQVIAAINVSPPTCCAASTAPASSPFATTFKTRADCGETAKWWWTGISCHPESRTICRRLCAQRSRCWRRNSGVPGEHV